MKTIEVIKVVRRIRGESENDSFHSFIISREPGIKALDRKYQIGRRTKPLVGFLYAFDKIEHAKLFTGSAGWLNPVFLKCKAEIGKHRSSVGMLKMSYNPTKDEVVQFWKGCYHLHRVAEAPEGTVFCKWIKPLEVVI